MRENQTIELHHERFRTLCKLDAGAWGVAEHLQLSNLIRYAAEVDQVDVTNLVSIEVTFRRLQTIEFNYQEKVREAEARSIGGRLSYEEQPVFMGVTRSHTQLMICPALLEHVKVDAEKEASLAKNLRKAREEREALRKRKDKD